MIQIYLQIIGDFFDYFFYALFRVKSWIVHLVNVIYHLPELYQINTVT